MTGVPAVHRTRKFFRWIAGSPAPGRTFPSLVDQKPSLRGASAAAAAAPHSSQRRLRSIAAETTQPPTATS